MGGKELFIKMLDSVFVFHRCLMIVIMVLSFTK